MIVFIALLSMNCKLIRFNNKTAISLGLIFSLVFIGINSLHAQPEETEGIGTIRDSYIFKTLFAPNETHPQGNLFDPWASTIDGKKCTIGDIIGPEQIRCTVQPFWYGVISKLFLQEAQPAMLDAEKINGQNFTKSVRAYSSEATSPLSSPSHYEPGIFPLELNLTYQQIPVRLPDTITLRELQNILSVFPYIRPVSAFLGIAESLAPLPEPLADIASQQGINKETATSIVKNDYTTSIQSPIWTEYTALGTLHPLTSSAILQSPPNFQALNSIASIFENLGITSKPSFEIKHTAAQAQTAEGTDKYKVFTDGTLLLEPGFKLFSTELAKRIRPKADFFCKSGPIWSSNSFGESKDTLIPFITDAWKHTCASLSGVHTTPQNEDFKLGPFADQTFSTFAHINGVSKLRTNYLESRTPVSDTAIGNQDTGHMDWFAAAAHCTARGGRLPRTDELLYMATNAAYETNSEFFLDTPHTPYVGTTHQGSFIYSSDFTMGASTTNYFKEPFVTALYLPPVGGGQPVGNPIEAWNDHFNSCQKIRDIAGDRTPRSNPFINWNEAALCRVSLKATPPNHTIHYENPSATQGQLLVSSITDPAASELEATRVASGYKTGDNHTFLNQGANAPSTHVTCIYE